MRQVGHRVPKDYGAQFLKPAVHHGVSRSHIPFSFRPGTVTLVCKEPRVRIVVSQCLDNLVKRYEAFRFCGRINHAFPNAAPPRKCRADQVGRPVFLPSE
ncbi:MAG: hypothetical protein RL260_2635 [Pseudomonadota bacterium]|jgi:hypothetical protein